MCTVWHPDFHLDASVVSNFTKHEVKRVPWLPACHCKAFRAGNRSSDTKKQRNENGKSERACCESTKAPFIWAGRQLERGPGISFIGSRLPRSADNIITSETASKTPGKGEKLGRYGKINAAKNSI
ncbi:hypothetical protein NDU88_000959 [Pleurodeles waltl]|uniref:Uncharacterized protein n=1 Tax=Pleurodeles waltl TaxID=8319 RepID=A0AAV7KPP1_PLEWA|nr:hypothetical protein NDU88_000959 [Pleurodeles waltl]